MIRLDDNLLIELGLGNLPVDEKQKMLKHIYDTLEMRVGTELANQMTDAQLLEFEEFMKVEDTSSALDWLERNFPNYRDVVASEFEKLRVEIKQAAPQIVAASNVPLSTPDQVRPVSAETDPPIQPATPTASVSPAAGMSQPGMGPVGPQQPQNQPQMPPQMPPQPPAAPTA